MDPQRFRELGFVPYSDEHLPLYLQFFKRNVRPHDYANGIAYFQQACRRKHWLKYIPSEEILLSLTSKSDEETLVFVNPLGSNRRAIVDRLADLSGSIVIDRCRVVLKKMPEEDGDLLVSAGFTLRAEDCHWREGAANDDDTYPEQIIDIGSLVEVSSHSGIPRGSVYQRLRTMVNNFQSHCVHVDVNSIECSELEYTTILRFLHEWAEAKVKKCSTESVEELVEAHSCFFSPGNLTNINRHFSKRALLVDGQLVGLYYWEKIGPSTAGLYACIADRGRVPGCSEQLIINAAVDAYSTGGCQYLNFGGSETEGLYNFRLKFNPVNTQYFPHWVYRGGEA